MPIVPATQSTLGSASLVSVGSVCTLCFMLLWEKSTLTSSLRELSALSAFSGGRNKELGNSEEEQQKSDLPTLDTYRTPRSYTLSVG